MFLTEEGDLGSTESQPPSTGRARGAARCRILFTTLPVT